MKLWRIGIISLAILVLSSPYAELCRSSSSSGYYGETTYATRRNSRPFLDDDTFLNWPNYDRIQKNLYLGNALAASDVVLLTDLNITHVLTIDTKHPDDKDDDIIYKRIYAFDSVDQDMLQYFEECYNFMRSGVKRGAVFVHCRIGVSRSATVVIAYLMRDNGWDFKTAFRYVKRRRPEINPNPGFIDQLKEYERILRTGKKIKCLLYVTVSAVLALTFKHFWR